MSLSDYAHWNEDAERIWWEEEGRHDPCDHIPEDYGDDWFDAGSVEAEEAYAEELGEYSDDQLIELIVDADYRARWPKAVPLIEWEIDYRKLLGA